MSEENPYPQPFKKWDELTQEEKNDITTTITTVQS